MPDVIPPPVPSTSAVAPAIPVAGVQLAFSSGSGGGSGSAGVVCNVADLDMPFTAETADATNVGCLWRLRVKTLLDMGKITFKIFWVMTEPTHENAAGGLRYLFLHFLPITVSVVYNDGNSSTDTFIAYVTGFKETGKVGGVWEASIELSNTVLGSVTPVLV
jgi:hypothetical protein